MEQSMERRIREANKKSDYVVFWAAVGASVAILMVAFGIGLWFALDTDPSELDEFGLGPVMSYIVNNITLLFTGLVALVFVLVMIRMMRQTYLGNALQVEYSDAAWLRTWANKVAKDLAMPKVEIMVTQDPVMNAFAFGFMKPYTIVLNSGTVRYATREQLKAIIVHEMAHIKFRHTQMGTYSGLLRIVPGFGLLFGWLLDFWSRRAEFSADRLALVYLQDVRTVKDALICVHIGPDMAPAFNDLAQQWQEYTTNSGFNRFTQTFSSHPFLVRRLQRLDAYSAAMNPVEPKEHDGHAK